MTAAPGTGGKPSTTSTGVVAAGLSIRNSSRRSQTRSSISAVLEAVFGERQPDVARMRAKRMMENCQHGAMVSGADETGIKVAQP